MRRTLAALILLAAAGALVVGCGGDNNSSGGGPTTSEAGTPASGTAVTIDNFAFSPATLNDDRKCQGWLDIFEMVPAEHSKGYRAQLYLDIIPDRLPSVTDIRSTFAARDDGTLALAMAGPPTFEWTWSYWIGLVWQAVFAYALCFSLYFPVVRKIGPGKAAYSSALVPIVAMALSTLFEGYRWTLLSASGAALAIGGIVLAVMSRRPAAPAPPAD